MWGEQDIGDLDFKIWFDAIYLAPVPSPPSTLKFRFNEGSGDTTADTSGQNHIGVLKSNLYPWELPNWDSSSHHTSAAWCLDFEAEYKEYVSVSDHDDFSFGFRFLNQYTQVYENYDRPFSVTAWIRTEYYGSYKQVIATKYESSGNNREWFFQIDKRGRIYACLFNQGTSSAYLQAYASSPRIYQYTWYFVSMTYDGSGDYTGLLLYLNGNPTNYAIHQEYGNYEAMSNGNAPLLVGSSGSYHSDMFFDGKIDDLVIYPFELSQSEITEIYNEYN